MGKVLLALLQLSFYIVLFTFIPVALLVRILSINQGKNNVKAKVLTIIDITSFAYYYYIPRDNKYRKLYNILLYVYLGLSFFAFAFAMHIYFL